jgi:hypothetical protein
MLYQLVQANDMAQARDAHILWTPADYKKKLLRRGDHPPGSVKVLRFLSDGDRKEAQRYKRDAGASFTDWRHSPLGTAQVLAEFHALVVMSDGKQLTRPFLVIDEYRGGISQTLTARTERPAAKGSTRDRIGCSWHRFRSKMSSCMRACTVTSGVAAVARPRGREARALQARRSQIRGGRR